MKPAAGIPDIKDKALNRTPIETADNASAFDAHEGADERAPNAFGETSNEEKPRDHTARDFDAASNTHQPHPHIALPPYLIANKAGSETSYSFVLPESMRPKSWPIATPLGSDHGHGPQEIAQKAWALYSHALHDMYVERAALKNDLHPATIKDVVREYKETPAYKNKPAESREIEDDNIHEILEWSDLNGHPPVATIAPEHMHAMLMTHGGDNASRMALRDTMVALYDHAAAKGYVHNNPATLTPLPHPQWHEAVKHAPIPVPVHIFAYKPSVPRLVIK